MHTVDQLIQDLPEFKGKIRRSHGLTRAAIIAAGPESVRTLVVTTACEWGGDYHLVHLFEGVPPTAFRWHLPESYSEEMRPEKWTRLLGVIRAFLAGADGDLLGEIASGRARV